LRLPESPRWLITHRGDRKAGLEVFRWINPNLSDAELNLLADQVQASTSKTDHAEKFFTARLRTPILLAFLIAFFNQLSGINAILYFAPRIFGMTGLAKSAAMLQSVGIGVTNLIFTYIGLWLIDRLGRRTLLYIGSFGYIASLGMCALAFFHWAPQFKVASSAMALVQATEYVETSDAFTRDKAEADFTKAQAALVKAASDTRYTPGPIVIAEPKALAAVKEIAEQALTTASKAAGVGGKMVMLCIFAFIAAHAIGQGAVIWVFISEIFPNRNRAAGQTLGSSTHWVFAALLTTVFPIMVEVMPPASIFGLFCFMMILQLIWVKFMVPETKGIPLEELQKKLFGGQN
jgi:MFS family permease